MEAFSCYDGVKQFKFQKINSKVVESEFPFVELQKLKICDLINERSLKKISKS